MRRLAAALILLFSVGALEAATCQSTGAGGAAGASACSAGTWTGCTGGGAPTASDVIQVLTGHVVNLDCNLTVLSIYVAPGPPAGLLKCVATTTPGNYNTLTLTANANAAGDSWGVNGEWRWAPGCDLNMAMTGGGNQDAYVGNDGNVASIHSDGMIGVSPAEAKTADLVTFLSSGPSCAGPEWTVSTSSTDGMAVGDLIQGASGGWFGLMHEIKALTATSLTFCATSDGIPDLADGSSLGPRLKPHQATSAVFLASTMPLPAPVPVTGDTFWAWHPWRIRKTNGGSIRYFENNGAVQGNGGRMEWVGGDVSGVSTGLGMRCRPGRAPVLFRHLNFHDNGTGSLAASGTSGTEDLASCDKPLYELNVVHDNAIPNAGYNIGIQRNDPDGSGACSGGSNPGATCWQPSDCLGGGTCPNPKTPGPVTSAMFFGNVTYRTHHNGLNMNTGFLGPWPILRGSMSWNRGFDLGGSADGECQWLEMDICQGCQARFNIGWKISQGCAAFAGGGTDFPSLYLDNMADANYFQGAKRGAIFLGATATTPVRTTVSRSWFQDLMEDCAEAWTFSGNVCKGWAQATVATYYPGISAAVVAEFNYMDGTNSPRAMVCLEDKARGSASSPSRYANNFLKIDGTAAGFTAPIIRYDGNHSADYLHNLLLCDSEVNCYGVQIRTEFAPTVAATINVKDSICFAACSGGLCACGNDDSSDPDGTTNLDRMTRFPVTATAATGSWTTKTNEYARDPLVVLQGALQVGSPELGTGGTPPGSPIGIRGTLWDKTLLPSWLWPAMVIPSSVANEPWSDEGDGYLTFMADASDDAKRSDKCGQIPDNWNGDDAGGSCTNGAAGAAVAPIKRAK